MDHSLVDARPELQEPQSEERRQWCFTGARVKLTEVKTTSGKILQNKTNLNHATWNQVFCFCFTAVTTKKKGRSSKNVGLRDKPKLLLLYE